MRKLLKFLSILLMGSICCACVNVFAVHELNDLAHDYMEAGNIEKAISRLEASIELDGKNYETRYNLATAYIGQGMCDEAIEHLEVAMDLFNSEPAVYYTHGVACECSADKIKEKMQKDNYKDEKSLKKYAKLLSKANDSFSIYVKKVPISEETKSIMDSINENSQLLSEIPQEYLE